MHNYNETYYRLKQTWEPLIALGSYQGRLLSSGTDFNILAFRKRPQTALVAFGNVCSESAGILCYPIPAEGTLSWYDSAQTPPVQVGPINLGWEAQLCHSLLSSGKATHIFHVRKLKTGPKKK